VVMMVVVMVMAIDTDADDNDIDDNSKANQSTKVRYSRNHHGWHHNRSSHVTHLGC
jgi:hypothetical protein